MQHWVEPLNSLVVFLMKAFSERAELHLSRHLQNLNVNKTFNQTGQGGI